MLTVVGAGDCVAGGGFAESAGVLLVRFSRDGIAIPGAVVFGAASRWALPVDGALGREALKVYCRIVYESHRGRQARRGPPLRR